MIIIIFALITYNFLNLNYVIKNAYIFIFNVDELRIFDFNLHYKFMNKMNFDNTIFHYKHEIHYIIQRNRIIFARHYDL